MFVLPAYKRYNRACRDDGLFSVAYLADRLQVFSRSFGRQVGLPTFYFPVIHVEGHAFLFGGIIHYDHDPRAVCVPVGGAHQSRAVCVAFRHGSSRLVGGGNAHTGGARTDKTAVVA